MKYLEYVCEVNPFTREQICYGILSDGNYEFVGAVPLNQLCDFLACNCHNSKVSKIHLVGPAIFLEKYKEGIKYAESCRYGNCTIEVEIN